MGEMADYYGIEDPRWFDDIATDDNVQQPFRDDPTEGTWVTREGQRIRVVDMTDSHLVNTIRYLRRTAQIAMMRSVVAIGMSDAAEMALGIEFDNVDYDECATVRVPTFAAMLAEAEKRGLRP